MKTRRCKDGWRSRLLLAVGLLSLLLLPAPAGAATKYWNDATNYWDVGAWNPTGQPQNGDDVYLYQSEATNRTVYYRNTAHPSAVLGQLGINASGSGTMTLNQGYGGYAHPLASIGEYIGVSGTGNGKHIQSLGTNNITTSLYLGYVSGAIGTYELSGGTLTAQSQYIGSSGTGLFNQTGGNNTTSNLNLGFFFYSSGTYKLQGGTLTAGTINLKYGAFNQTGGTLNYTTFNQTGGSSTFSGSNYLYVGKNSGSSESYNLSGGSLSAPNQYIGNYGTGLFKQSGGTNSANLRLYLGDRSGSSGTYELSGGSLTGSDQYIGNYGTGLFKQSNGATNTLTNTLYLGDRSGSSGTYELSGGSLSAPIQYIGNYGTGVFTQTGGANTVTNTLMLGYYSGSSGTYNLQGGSLTAGGIVLHSNDNFNQTGGTLSYTNFYQQGGTVTGSLENRGAYNYQSGTFSGRLLNYGTANLYYGDNASFTAGDGLSQRNSTALSLGSGKSLTLNGQGLEVDNGGAMNLTGGTLNTSSARIGVTGSGTFTQSSGSNTTTSNLDIAGPGGSGAYNLQGGSLSTGIINLNTGGSFQQTGGSLNATTFNQQGGTVTGSLENRGAYNYSGGVFQGRLLNYGSTNLGADFTAGDGLRQDAAATALNIGSGRTVTLNGAGLDNCGTINLSGGSLSGSGAKTNKGTLAGYGAINGSGALENYGAINLSGGVSTVSTDVINRAAGQLNVGSGGAVNFTGPVTNYGQVKATGATVTWGGTFRNYGGYLSDPSTQYFSNLYVEQGGYLVGGAGDRFSVSGSLINYSLNNAKWSTLLADLAFTGGGYHQLFVTGADLGQNIEGYDANFAWNRLDLIGQSLTLLDGDGSQAGGALYVREILGLTRDGSLVTNLTATDVNIYYDRTAAGNSYLGGLSYDLSGGGHLLAANPVPAPSTLLLLGSGLLGLVGWRRYRKN